MIARFFAFSLSITPKSFSSSSDFKSIEAPHLSGHNSIKSEVQNISFVILVSRASFLHDSSGVRISNIGKGEKTPSQLTPKGLFCFVIPRALARGISSVM